MVKRSYAGHDDAPIDRIFVVCGTYQHFKGCPRQTLVFTAVHVVHCGLRNLFCNTNVGHLATAASLKWDSLGLTVATI